MDPDQYVMSDLVQHCLSVPLKKEARLMCVKALLV